MEEKEKECTGRDQCGAHTHIQSLSLSASRSLTRPEPRSAQDPERRGKVAAAFIQDLIAWGKFVCSVKPPSLWNPVLEAQHLGTPAVSSSRTIHSLSNNSGHRRHQRGTQTAACGALGTPAGLPPSDAWPAWSSCETPASRIGSLFAPPGGQSKLRLQTPSRGLEEVAARIRGFTKPGPLRPGPRCGSVPCALH